MPLERPPLLPNEAPSGDLLSAKYQYGLRWQSHPGFGLKARALVTAFRMAEAGYPQVQCDMFDDIIERDGHLRAALGGRLLCVAGRDWILQAGGDTPSDKRAAEVLEEALRRQPFNFLKTMVHQLKAAWFGWSASEIRWERVKDQTVPTWFANPSHRRFNFDKDDCPLLVGDVPVVHGDSVGEPLAPGSWWYSESPLHHIVARAGLMRTAAWWSMFKSMAITDWLVLAAMFGIPYRTGKYGSQTPDTEKDVLKQAVQQLGTDGAAVMSDTCEIVVTKIDAGGSDAVHGAIAALCNAEISKVISGGTLTSGEGTSTGSYALGKVHENRSYDNVTFDAKLLAMSFETGVAAPFLHWNGFPAWTKPPRLKVNITRDTDPAQRAQIVSLLANTVGLELDEEQIRQENQLKHPTGTPLKGTAVKQAETAEAALQIKAAGAGAPAEEGQ